MSKKKALEVSVTMENMRPLERWVLEHMIADTVAEFVEWVEKYESEVEING